MRDIFKIFKRKASMDPNPDWWQLKKDLNCNEKRFQDNVISGVNALENGKDVMLYEDGRGYELALQIKQQFILNRQRELAEKIEVKPLNDGKIGILWKIN